MGPDTGLLLLKKDALKLFLNIFFMCFRFYKVPLMTHSLKWVFLFFFLVNPRCFLSWPVEIEALWRVHAEELGSGNKPPGQNCQPQFGVGRLKGGQNGHSWRLEELNDDMRTYAHVKKGFHHPLLDTSDYLY